MTHIINVRQDNAFAMRSYVSKMPEIAQVVAKYSWVKSLDGLPIIAKLAIGLIAYPVAYLHDFVNRRSIKDHTLNAACESTLKELNVDYSDYRSDPHFSCLYLKSALDLGFLEKTTPRYHKRLKQEAEHFIRNQFPFPCILKPQKELNKTEDDTNSRSVCITQQYDIYYEDICVGSLTVRSEDHFSKKNAHGTTTYELCPQLKSIEQALEKHHLIIFKDYLFSSFQLDLKRLTIESRHSEVHSSEANLKIRKKYRILYDGLSMGTVSFTGDFEIRHGKVQGSMKHHYNLLTRTFEKRKRAKVSI